MLESGEPLHPALVVALCDRHSGVGGDGLLEPVPAERADYGVRIWNPDGSIAEKSGNGLRIFARWLADRGAGARFTVATGGEVVGCEVGADRIAIEMGVARILPIEPALWVDGEAVPVVGISVGNPHCVVFVDGDPGESPWARWGAALEVHPAFPNRTNVQVARVLGPDVIEIRIWERGAGPTLASGSSSCAVAAAAVATGRARPGRIRVQMPGGELIVWVGGDLSVRLEGPVAPVGRIEVDSRWAAAAVLG